MNWKTTINIIIISAVCISSLKAQEKSRASGFRDLFKPEAEHHEYTLNLDTRNEFRLVLTGGFAFYKTFISSQDGGTCTFYPSCSVYALNTIKTNGFIGILDAIDRLTRCNGMSPKKYPIDHASQRFYDPVQKIRKKK